MELVFFFICSSKLDNYYECFLQIENEKNCFKEKYEQVAIELEELKERFEAFEADALEVKPSDKSGLEEKMEVVENEEVKKISAEHVNNELKEAKKIAETVGEEKRKSIRRSMAIQLDTGNLVTRQTVT